MVVVEEDEHLRWVPLIHTDGERKWPSRGNEDEKLSRIEIDENEIAVQCNAGARAAPIRQRILEGGIQYVCRNTGAGTH